MTDTNSELRVVPSPTHPHFAAINDSNGMNIMLTLDGTPVMPTRWAELVVALLQAPHLFAGLWGDGYLAGLADMQNGHERPNPYRNQPTNDSDLILTTLDAVGVAKTDQFDALVAVQKLIK